MTRPSFRLAVLAAALVIGGAAAPGVGATPLKLVGFDDMSCRAWADSKGNAERRQLYLAWIRGLLTGHNYARPAQQVSAVSSGTIENYVERYCKDNPQSDFVSAALRMSDSYSGRNEPIVK